MPAITAQQRADLVLLVNGVFGAAPTNRVLSNLVKLVEEGNSVDDIATMLTNNTNFESIYSPALLNSEFATEFTANLLGAAATTETTARVEALVTSYLTAGDTRTEAVWKVTKLLSETEDAAFATAKTQLNNKADVSLTFALDTSYTKLMTLEQLQSVIANVTSDEATVTAAITAIANGTAVAGVSTGETFTLTTGADTPENTSGNDVYVATDATLTAADSISGGAGNDKLDYSAAITGNVSHGALTMTDVETFEVTVDSNTATDTASFDLSGATGLQTVRVDNSSASVAFNQLTGLSDVEINNLTGAAGTTTVEFQDSVVAGTADEVNLTVNDTAMGTLTVGSVSDANGGVETLNITTAGQATTIGQLDSDISTLNVAGDQALTITTDLNNTVNDINADTMTGALTAGLSASTQAVAVDTGSAADSIDASKNNGVVTANMGAGDDTLDMGANLASTDVIDGGADSDTLVVTTVAVAANGTADAAGETFANTSNVETLQFSSVTSGALDAADYATTNTDGSGAVSAGIMTYDFDRGVNGGVTLQNVADNSTVMFDDQDTKVGANGQSLTVTNATDGAADTTNLVFDLDLANDTTGAVTLNDAETINIVLNDNDDTTVNGLGMGSLVSADMTTLDIDGNANFAVNSQITTGALATVDASGNTGSLTINIDDATDVSAATAQNLAVTSSDANDMIFLGGANNFGAYTVTSGNGDDTITLTSANNTVTHTVTAGDSDADTAGNGTITVNGATANVTAGDNGWTVTTSTGADNITTGAGDDTIIAGLGNDRVVAGAGDDIIWAGNGTAAAQLEGIDYLDGGAGDDQFNFTYSTNASTEGLTSADTVIGGDGTDTINIVSAGVNITDQVFNGVSTVEILDLVGNGTNSVTINTIGLNAGIETIKGGTGNDTVNVGEGFTNALTIDLSDGGDDTVVATNAPGAITVFAQDSDITSADSITGGTGSDTVQIEAANGVAILSGVSAIENINITSDATTNVNDVAQVESTTVILGSNTVAANSTLNITAANMVGYTDTSGTTTNPSATIDASGVSTNGGVNVTGSVGNDTVFGTANADTINGGAGDDTIYGGRGADTLEGGAGDDQFTYAAVADSSSTNTDTISDFAVSNAAGTVVGDTIVIDTALLGALTLNFAGNQANFASAQGATTQGDALVDYVFQTDTNTLWVDINNDGTLNADDLQIKLDGVTSITQYDVVSAVVNTTIAAQVLTVAQAATATSLYSLQDTAANLVAAASGILNNSTNITATTAATVAQATVIDNATNSGSNTYSMTDTAANLAAAASSVGNGATNITATDAATVAQATAIEAFTNGGTNTYNIADTSANLAASSNAVLTLAGTVTATDAATVAQATVIDAFAKAVTFAVVDSAAVIAASSDAALDEATSVTANTAATAAQATTIAGFTTPVVYSVSDTAANIAAAAGAGLNEAVNITATSAATVAQAGTIEAATNTGTNTYDIVDSATAIAGSSNAALALAGTVTANTNATVAQATIIDAFATAVTFAVRDTAASIAAEADETNLDEATSVTASTTATVANSSDIITNIIDNGVAVSYAVRDTAASIAAATDADLDEATSVTANSNATVIEAAAIDALATAVTFAVRDTAANIAVSSDAALDEATSVSASSAATAAEAATIAGFTTAVTFNTTDDVTDLVSGLTGSALTEARSVGTVTADDTAAALATALTTGDSELSYLVNSVEVITVSNAGALTVNGQQFTNFQAGSVTLGTGEALVIDGTNETVNLGTLSNYGGSGVISFGATGGSDKYTVNLGTSGVTTINLEGTGNHDITAASGVIETFVLGDTYDSGVLIRNLESSDIVNIEGAGTDIADMTTQVGSVGDVDADGEWFFGAEVLTYWDGAAQQSIGLVGVTSIALNDADSFVVV